LLPEGEGWLEMYISRRYFEPGKNYEWKVHASLEDLSQYLHNWAASLHRIEIFDVVGVFTPAFKLELVGKESPEKK
jgi:hypothetical protein